MRWPWQRRDPLAQLPAVIADWQATQRRKRDEARLDAVIEMNERAAMDCAMCDEIGEPHVCARQWWRDRLAHYQGQSCSDAECPCRESIRLREEARALWPAR